MNRISKIDVLGGGPAGLYTAILIRRMLPDVEVTVSEQNEPGATFGFGVVFSDQALDFLKADDLEAHRLISPQMERWRNMTLNHPNGVVTLDGVGFSAIGRLELIEILKDRAEALGATVLTSRLITSLDELDGDLIIGADGLNSLVRQSDEAGFRPKFENFNNHFAWFGTPRTFDTLTQTFVETGKGAMNAHHYRFKPDMSTFLVECDDETFSAYGFEEMDEQESAIVCEKVFADVLDGAPLVTNKSMWRQFPRLWCESWISGNKVLMGDAVHTAHFSIGSGTRLAMEDAHALVSALSQHEYMEDALNAYQLQRPPIAKKIVDAANTSAQWYETFSERIKLPPLDFAFDYMTRSGRVSIDKLRKRAPLFMSRYETEKSKQVSAITDPVDEGTKGAKEIEFEKSDHPNCSSILWQNLKSYPDKLAITGPAGNVTYGGLCKQAARWGNAFLASGLQPGSRIPFLLDDTPSYPAAMFGAMRAGFVPVLLNTQTTPELLNFFLKDTGASIALCEVKYKQLFEGPAIDGTLLNKIILVNHEGEPDGQMISQSDFIGDQPTELSCANTKPDDMAFWMYSSGTTGKPKGIVHLHHDMAYVQMSYGQHVLKLEADDVCFSAPKVFFAYGCGNSFIFPFSVGATTVLLPGRPDPESVLDIIEEYKPTVLFGLPTLYTAICRSKGIDKRDLSSLRQSMSAAEILSEDIYNAWKKLTGHGPTEGLGSTELLHIYLSNSLDDHRIGAAGKRVPGYEVKLIDSEGKLVKSGNEGVMLVRGDSSSPLYWNQSEKTQDTMRKDWIYTGDRFIEKSGHFYFQGRADDLVKVSGQWVWPLEVERCLNDHPDVHECAVLPFELPDRRVVLRAIICLCNPQSAGDDETQKLQQYVKKSLLPFKYPRMVEYVSELPKTGTGKIDRHALREMKF